MAASVARPAAVTRSGAAREAYNAAQGWSAPADEAASGGVLALYRGAPATAGLYPLSRRDARPICFR